MIKKMLKNSTLNTKLTRIIILALFFIAIVANIFALSEALQLVRKYKEIMPFQGIGYRHKGLEEFIPKNTKYVGYYTGQEIGYGKDSKYFAQAQYMLAPLILDHNNLEHKYIIFSCDERIAAQKIKELNLAPLRRNKFGIILAAHKNANTF